MKKVFISHAAEDSLLAETLQRWIDKEAFPSRCTTFVSSSRESISIGEEWFNKIKKGLKEAQILFCLLGPTTKDRPWLHFEAGAAWLEGKGVVAVLHSGLSHNDVSGPLSQLQYLRLADKNLADTKFPTDFFEGISKACGLPVPTIDLKQFAEEVEAAARQMRGPREVVSLWNKSLYEGELDLAAELLSKDANDEFIEAHYVSLEELSNNYKKAKPYHQVYEAIHFGTDAAIVVYYVVGLKEDYFVTRYEDVVLLEGEKWKFAPQYVVKTQLRPPPHSSTRKTGPTKPSRRTP
ncbi:MAG: toll/interleukin-1 receptor domain-containing protein [Nitrososphaera sp.]|nr:toll/interleukin-1 receptor domain-containing protein [Nitrososphaera sp.]